ncbi:MAG: ATP-binding cassette domain-containing protein [Acidimicrobiia bacterium]
MSRTTEAVIETRQLTKRFGSLTAVDSLDLEVRRGEIFGYLGPNGAGKTTTIRLCLDFLRPTSGSLRVLDGTGRDPAVRRRTGYLPGDLKLDPRYTANDVLEFYGRLRGGLDQALVADLLERFDLDPTRPAGELSTGNRRKIGIVQAFAHRPELLILDEPTSGLDPLLQHEFQQVLRRAVADGATVFLSSHVLPEVEALAHRVGILRQGRLVAVAGIDELRAQARQRIDFHVTPPADPSVFAGIPEVVSVEAEDGAIHVVVEGSVDRVIKAAAGLEVLRVVTHDTDLEDIFLRYYQGDPG